MIAESRGLMSDEHDNVMKNRATCSSSNLRRQSGPNVGHALALKLAAAAWDSRGSLPHVVMLQGHHDTFVLRAADTPETTQRSSPGAGLRQ